MTWRRSVPGSRTRGPDDAGVVAVEFALVLPLLIVLLFTIILGGGVYLDQLNLQSAARNGARVGSVTPTSACVAATTDLAGNDVGTVSCEVLDNCTAGRMRLRLTAQQTVPLPIVGDRSVTLRATSSYACPR
ncbi:MAG: TadE-like protein [Actinomycetota bacterium]